MRARKRKDESLRQIVDDYVEEGIPVVTFNSDLVYSDGCVLLARTRCKVVRWQRDLWRKYC